MKVIAPSPLVQEAADVLAPIYDDVVVIGAFALQMLLDDELDGSGQPVAATRDLDMSILMTPTSDVDLSTQAELADAVVANLEAAGLEPSSEPHEKGFTWVRDDLKIQLVRPFHPFAKGAARGLPVQTHLSLLMADEHRIAIAFQDDPSTPRLQSATLASLVALKQVAFGRKRPDGQLVERDYHDVFLVISSNPDTFETSYRSAQYNVRSLVDMALAALAAGSEATQAAARQHAQIGGDRDIAAHELSIVRAAVFMQRRLGASADSAAQ